jgi:hypothetical protein
LVDIYSEADHRASPLMATHDVFYQHSSGLSIAPVDVVGPFDGRLIPCIPAEHIAGSEGGDAVQPEHVGRCPTFRFEDHAHGDVHPCLGSPLPSTLAKKTSPDVALPHVPFSIARRLVLSTESMMLNGLPICRMVAGVVFIP